jgi:hypothetical protein
VTERQHDVSRLLIPASPPIDEARREALRRNPNVTYYERPDPERGWTYEPTLAVDEPIDVNWLIDGDEDEFDESQTS